MEHFEFDIDLSCEKKRLDIFISESQTEITRSYVQKLIEGNFIEVNGASPKASYKLKIGDHVELTLPDPEPLDVLPEAIALNIVFEDEAIIVVDKPAGMVVHPAPGHPGGTLVNALLHHCADLTGIGGIERPGIVHRLDKDTSGLIVIAKTDEALQSLASQFKNRDIKKVYLALVKGTVRKPKGVIDSPIGRHKAHRKKMSATASNKTREAQTEYEVVRQFDEFAYLRLHPKTGRTHQIRVHLASMGNPILGDVLYGGKSKKIDRQALHAHKLELIHPGSGKIMSFESRLPEDISALLK